MLRYSAVNILTYSSANGLRMKVNRKAFMKFKSIYEARGYTTTDEGDLSVVACNTEIAEKEIPLFIHAYIDKVFGDVPDAVELR